MGLVSDVIDLIKFSLKVLTILIGGASLQIFWKYQFSLLASFFAKLVSLLAMLLLVGLVIVVVLFIFIPWTIQSIYGVIGWVMKLIVGIIVAILEISPLIISNLRYVVIILVSAIVLPSYGILLLKGIIPFGLVKMVISPSMGLSDKMLFIFTAGIKEAMFIAKNNKISYLFCVLIAWILSYFIPSQRKVLSKITGDFF